MSRPIAPIIRGNCKTPIWGQIRAFCAGSGFSRKSPTLNRVCQFARETGPAQKSSNLASKASFAITSEDQEGSFREKRRSLAHFNDGACQLILLENFCDGMRDFDGVE